MIIFFYLKMIFVILFFSTAIHKVRYRKRHVQAIKAYEIIKEEWASLFFYIFLIFEGYISLSLIFTGFTIYNTLVCLLLLSVYTIAVGINLARGRRNLSCGCGGVLESEQLNFGIVFRNLFLMCLFLLSFFLQDLVSHPLTVDQMISIALIAGSSLLVIGIGKEIKKLKVTLGKLSQKFF